MLFLPISFLAFDEDDKCIRTYTSAFDDHEGTWKIYGTSALETTNFVMSAAPHMCLDTDETLIFFCGRGG